jgi:hypothetical protein
MIQYHLHTGDRAIRISTQLATAPTTASLAAHADAFCQRVRCGLAEADFERRRALVELLIDRVIVTDSEVEIRYVFPTSSKGERERFCRLRMDYQTGFLDGNDRRNLTGAGLCLLLQLRKPHQQAGDIPGWRRMLRHLLAGPRRQRGDQPCGPTEFHRDEDCAKIGADSGLRGPVIE